MNDALREQISAYVDGELPDHETEMLLRRLAQDPGLRDLVARYMSISRSMRSEPAIAGLSGLREKISVALESEEEIFTRSTASTAARFVKPLAGVAVAASVAVLALVGFQQTSDNAGLAARPTAAVVSQLNNDVAGYTVPARDESSAPSDMLQRYYVKHGESVMASGANGIRSRLVSFELRENEIIEQESALDEQNPGIDDVGNINIE